MAYTVLGQSNQKNTSMCDRQETTWLCCIFMSDISTKVSFFFIKKNKYRQRRHDSAVTDSQSIKSEESKRQHVLHLQILICNWRPELCTEAACDRDRVRSSPNSLQDCMHARTRAQKKVPLQKWRKKA